MRPFIADSGAADVQVSADVFLALFPQGTLGGIGIGGSASSPGGA